MKGRCSVWSHQKTLFGKLNSRNAPLFKQDMMISANDDHQAIFDHDWPSQFWPQSITLSTIENVTYMTYHMSHIISRYNISEIWFRMKSKWFKMKISTFSRQIQNLITVKNNDIKADVALSTRITRLLRYKIWNFAEFLSISP